MATVWQESNLSTHYFYVYFVMVREYSEQLNHYAVLMFTEGDGKNKAVIVSNLWKSYVWLAKTSVIRHLQQLRFYYFLTKLAFSMFNWRYLLSPGWQDRHFPRCSLVIFEHPRCYSVTSEPFFELDLIPFCCLHFLKKSASVEPGLLVRS